MCIQYGKVYSYSMYTNLKVSTAVNVIQSIHTCTLNPGHMVYTL